MDCNLVLPRDRSLLVCRGTVQAGPRPRELDTGRPQLVGPPAERGDPASLSNQPTGNLVPLRRLCIDLARQILDACRHAGTSTRKQPVRVLMIKARWAIDIADDLSSLHVERLDVDVGVGPGRRDERRTANSRCLPPRWTTPAGAIESDHPRSINPTATGDGHPAPEPDARKNKKIPPVSPLVALDYAPSVGALD
jgi:hypothetical protein